MMSKGNEGTRCTPAPAKGSGGWRLGVIVVSVLAVVAFAAWYVLVWRADHAGVPQISAPIGPDPVQAPPRDNDQARSIARTSPPRPATPAAPLVAAGNTNKPPVAPVTAVSADTRTAAEKAADEAIAEAQALLGESEGVTDDVVATQPARRP